MLNLCKHYLQDAALSGAWEDWAGLPVAWFHLWDWGHTGLTS